MKMRRMLAVLGLLTAGAQGEEAVWEIAPRTLAPPAAASEALREAVAQTPTPTLAERAAVQPRTAGVVADLNVYEGLSHAEYAFLVGSSEYQ